MRALRKNTICTAGAFVLGLLCALWFLPYFIHQADTGFFAYTREFVAPFFEGIFGAGFASAPDQGIVAGCGVDSGASLWAGASPEIIKPRLPEFLWRFVSQFYLNIPLMILLTALWCAGFICLSWRAFSYGAVFMLPLFLFFFTHPEPIHAAVSVNLTLDMAMLALLVRLGRRAKDSPSKRRRGIFFSTLLLCFALSLWLWRGNYTPAFAPYPPAFRFAAALYPLGIILGLLRFKGRIWRILMPAAAGCCALFFVFGMQYDKTERLVIKARNAAAGNRYEKCLRLCDDFWRDAEARGEYAAPTHRAALRRFEMAAWLKLSLLQTGQLNNRFLDYSDFSEMNLMYPAGFPFPFEAAYAYMKLYDALGIYAPQLPFVLTACEKAGYQKRFMEILLRAEAGTSQKRLYARTQLYLSRTVYRLPDVAPLNGFSEVDGALPVKLSDPALTEGAYNLDGWVRIYFRREPEAANLPLIDYYSLLSLIDKNLEALPDLIQAYAHRRTKILPAYLQEALCIAGSASEAVLQEDFAGYRVGYDNWQTVNEVYRERTRLQRKQLRFDELTRRYGNTYTYYYLFGRLI